MIFEALHLVDLVDEAQFTYVHPKDEVFKVFHTKFGCLQVGFEASIAVRVVQEVLERFGPEGRQNTLSDFILRVSWWESFWCTSENLGLSSEERPDSSAMIMESGLLNLASTHRLKKVELGYLCH